MHLLLCTLNFCIMICLMKEFHIKIKRKLNKMGELFQLPYFSDGKTKAWRKSDCPKKYRPSGPIPRLQLPFLTLSSQCSLTEPCILHAMHPVCVTLHLKKKKIQKERQLFLEEEMATQSSILAWEIPWTEEPGGLQSMGWQRVRND